jgi:hypothetical protein
MNDIVLQLPFGDDGIERELFCECGLNIVFNNNS